MPFAYTVLTTTGVSGDFAVPFPYFEPEHLEVRLNNTIVGFTVLSASSIRLTPTPAAGQAVTIRRVTPPNYTVPTRLFPTLVRYLSEESSDILYSFDALYGEIYYDVVFSATDVPTDATVVGSVKPLLNLSPTDQNSVVLTEAVASDVTFTVSRSGTPYLTGVVAAGQLDGLVTQVSSDPILAGDVLTLTMTSSVAVPGITVLARHTRN